MLKGDISILTKEVKLSTNVAGGKADVGGNLPTLIMGGEFGGKDSQLS